MTNRKLKQKYLEIMKSQSCSNDYSKEELYQIPSQSRQHKFHASK